MHVRTKLHTSLTQTRDITFTDRSVSLVPRPDSGHYILAARISFHFFPYSFTIPRRGLFILVRLLEMRVFFSETHSRLLDLVSFVVRYAYLWHTDWTANNYSEYIVLLNREYVQRHTSGRHHYPTTLGSPKIHCCSWGGHHSFCMFHPETLSSRSSRTPRPTSVLWFPSRGSSRTPTTRHIFQTPPPYLPRHLWVCPLIRDCRHGGYNVVQILVGRFRFKCPVIMSAPTLPTFLTLLLRS